MRFESGTIVEGPEGLLGVVVDNLLGCCASDEIPVVWEGTTYFSGTPADTLRVIGPENAVADFEKCGGGQGENACIFLVIEAGGAKCQRFGNRRNDQIFRTMRAKRHPTEMYPACQLPTSS